MLDLVLHLGHHWHDHVHHLHHWHHCLRHFGDGGWGGGW